MFFQAGPDNRLGKFTWRKSVFFSDGKSREKFPVLLSKSSVDILACCGDSIGTTEQEITGFLLEFPLQTTVGFQHRYFTDLQMYYGSLLKLTSLLNCLSTFYKVATSIT